MIIFCLYLIYATISIVYAACQMKNSMFGPEVKRLILKRHIAYIAVFSTLNIFMLIGNALYIRNEDEQFWEEEYAWIKLF